MSDEYIKDILIELIKQKQIYLGTSNEEIARSMAEFINTLREETERSIL